MKITYLISPADNAGWSLILRKEDWDVTRSAVNDFKADPGSWESIGAVNADGGIEAFLGPDKDLPMLIHCAPLKPGMAITEDLGDLPPDPEGMNDERAEWADVAIRAFADVTNMDTAGEDDETILGDLLTDLRHWCDRSQISWEAMLARAESHYEEETRDE